jgi:hypothetical protein
MVMGPGMMILTGRLQKACAHREQLPRHLATPATVGASISKQPVFKASLKNPKTRVVADPRSLNTQREQAQRSNLHVENQTFKDCFVAVLPAKTGYSRDSLNIQINQFLTGALSGRVSAELPANHGNSGLRITSASTAQNRNITITLNAQNNSSRVAARYNH